jgi:fucose permease
MGEQEGEPILVHRMHSINTHMSQVGERRVLFIYSILAIGLELIVWLVPSLISGGVAVSIIGVILGPLYPIAMNHAVRILPGWLLTGNLVFVSMRW